MEDLDDAITTRNAAIAAAKAAATADAATAYERQKAAEEQREQERRAIALTVRGGLCRLSMPNPLSDGFRTFTATEIMEYIDMADRRGQSTAATSLSSTVCGLQGLDIATRRVSCVSSSRQ